MSREKQQADKATVCARVVNVVVLAVRGGVGVSKGVRVPLRRGL